MTEVDPAFSRYVKQLDEFSCELQELRRVHRLLRTQHQSGQRLSESDGDLLRGVDMYLEEVRARLI